MKKIKESFMIFIFFIIINNNNYATVSGEYVPSKTSGSTKVLFFLIGFILVSLVLFIGYKLDKMEDEQKRKNKYKKHNKNEEDVYDSIFSSKKYENSNKLSQFNDLKNDEDDVIENIDINDESIKDLINDYINEEDSNIEQDETRKDIDITEMKVENPELDNISEIFDTTVISGNSNDPRHRFFCLL